jgi:hypothetical protein
MDHVALVVQTQGSAPQPFPTCGARYLMDDPAVKAARMNFSNFGLRFTGQNGVIFNGSRASSGADTHPDPTGFLVQATNAQTVGQKTTLGTVNVFFGTGAEFRCQSAGADPWQPQNSSNETFFEFRATNHNTQINTLSGNFQCIARNVSDPNDNRVLFIVHGGFTIQIE